VLKRGKGEQCPPQAAVQYIMTKILQKYSKFSFYNTVYSAHNENKIQYPDIDMCIGEPLVWMTSYFYCKKFSSDKRATVY